MYISQHGPWFGRLAVAAALLLADGAAAPSTRTGARPPLVSRSIIVFVVPSAAGPNSST